jgi:hypothetical protein
MSDTVRHSITEGLSVFPNICLRRKDRPLHSIRCRCSRRLLQTATQPALRHPIIIRLALPPAAAVLIDIETSSSNQSKQYAFGS